MDIVEVSPPYDHAETTAMIANRAALEAISALAVKRRDGAAVRFAGAPNAGRAGSSDGPTAG
jgi:agmatinase